MDTKFTPGPWNNSSMAMSKKDWAGLWNDELTIVRAKWDGFTGEVVACVWADDDKEEFANARLIAAAPELFDLLTRAQEELRLLHMKDTGATYDVTLRLEMNAALAKVQP